MATTQLSDLVAHDKEFLATVAEKMTDLSVLRNAGVIVNSPVLNERANGAGKLTSIPFWNTLTQTESAVGSDDPDVSITPGKIAQGEMIAVRNFRNSAWSAMNLAGALIGDDPMGAIAQRVAEYWANDEERMVISILKGILAADVAGSDVLYVGNGTTDVLNYSLLVDAAGTAGDAASQFKVLVMHSDVHRKMQKDEENDYIPASKTDLGFATYAGFRIVISDLMPKASSVYTSVLCAPGAILAGEGQAKRPIAVAFNEAAGNGSGQESLYHRRQFILHPNGLKFNSSSIGAASPTNAEFEEAAQWTQAYGRKNIPLAFIKSVLA
jgi:Major capsid protein 13-like